MQVNKCQHCESTENLMIISTRKLKNGTEAYSFMCRPCNTERHRKYRSTEQGKQNIYKAVYKSTQKHIERQLARAKMNYNLKMGKITKPTLCASCSLEKKLEGHHEDYSKPLEVKWLCRGCHSDHHKQDNVCK